MAQRTPNPVLVATTEAVNRFTASEFTAIVNDGIGYGYDFARKVSQNSFSQFCGFAQLNLKLRKNHKYARILRDAGWHWCDYRKAWNLYGGVFTNSQHMDYKEAILREVQKAFSAAGIRTSISLTND